MKVELSLSILLKLEERGRFDHGGEREREEREKERRELQMEGEIS